MIVFITIGWWSPRYITRLVSAAVEVLLFTGSEKSESSYQQSSAYFPFIPDRGDPMPAIDKHQVLVHVPSGFQALSGREFADLCVIGVPDPDQV